METKLYKYIIKYTNLKEYHSLKDEIFGSNIYEFESSNDSPVIIDIGAHIGLSVLYFKREFPNAKILAFEPNPKLCENLKENIFRNGIQDVEVIEKAVSDIEGKAKLYIDPTVDEWFSTGSLRNGGWTGREEVTPIEIESVRLDKYITDIVDMLKIDAEGKEEEILNSIKGKLRLVKNVAIEYHPGSNFEKIVNTLRHEGLEVTFLQEGYTLEKPDTKKLIIIKGRKIL